MRAMLLAVLVSCALLQAAEAIRVGAFNCQVFGQQKLKDARVADVIARVVARYDLLLFQEIRDASQTAFPALVEMAKRISGRPLAFVVSERLGRTDSKEQYGYLYDTSKVSIASTYVYEDKKKLFERPPFVADVRVGSSRVVMVGLHAAPNDAAAEVSALVSVYNDVEARFGSLPVVLLGDLNADCAYISNRAMEGVKLHRDRRFSWQLRRASTPAGTGRVVATTTTGSQCVYDRIVTSGFQAGAINSASVFLFDKVYRLDAATTAKVSDHYPVEITLFERGSGALPVARGGRKTRSEQEKAALVARWRGRTATAAPKLRAVRPRST